MAAPTLTTGEVTQLQTDQAIQQNAATAFTAQVPAQNARIAELQVSDGAFKKIFDYYNDQIIGQYDAEQRALNGLFISSPVIEQDVIDVSNLTGRLLATPPVTDIVRVPEFDGGGTNTDPLNETQQNIDTQTTANVLVNGYGSGTATTATAITTLTPSSTTVSVTNISVETIQVNDIYILDDGLNIAVIQIDSIADGGGANPPYLTDLGVTIIVPPPSLVSTGAGFSTFLGFSNGERSTKTTSNSLLQPLLDSLVVDLTGELNARIVSLDTQDATINANDDADGTTELATALSLNSIARIFIQNYLISTDISDTGLASLASERSSRGAEITARISEIVAAFTGQTINYYDKRYDLANDRGNTARGTLRQQVLAQDVVGVSQSYGQTATDAATSIGNLLP